jgi:hypothetical protein
MDVYNALLNIKEGEIAGTCWQEILIGGLAAPGFIPPIPGVLLPLRKKLSGDGREDWLKRVARMIPWATVGLALFLWLGDAFVWILWPRKDMGSLAESLFPLYSPRELLSFFLLVSQFFLWEEWSHSY